MKILNTVATLSMCLGLLLACGNKRNSITSNSNDAEKNPELISQGEGSESDAVGSVEEQSLSTISSEVPSDWKKIDASGSFSFSLPNDMVQLEIQGIDSFVQVYSNEDLRISFDYGPYSRPTNTPKELVDGKRAEIIESMEEVNIDEQAYTQHSLILFEDIEQGTTSYAGPIGLTMSARFTSDTSKEIAKKILRSIKFLK